MLTPYLQSKFIRKILTASDGREYDVLFWVSLVDGEPVAKIVSAEIVNSVVGYKLLVIGKKAENNSQFLLPISRTKNQKLKTKNQYNNFVSPYFSLEYLINSQPTRAPAR